MTVSLAQTPCMSCIMSYSLKHSRKLFNLFAHTTVNVKGQILKTSYPFDFFGKYFEPLNCFFKIAAHHGMAISEHQKIK